MVSGIGFKRHLVLIELIFVMVPRFYSGCFALIVPSEFSARMHQRIGTKALSMVSSVEKTRDEATLLEPRVVSSKVFDVDQRPVILFDGGMSLNCC